MNKVIKKDNKVECCALCKMNLTKEEISYYKKTNDTFIVCCNCATLILVINK